MIALITAEGETIQYSGVEYAEQATNMDGESGIAMQFEDGETNFVPTGTLIGTYQSHVFEVDAHTIDREV